MTKQPLAVEYRKISTLKELEKNPRTISKKQFETLKKSLADNPDYFEARPLILSDRTGELVVLAGNQRLKAARSLKMTEVPTVLIPNLTEEREREIIIRDNVNNGEWDMDLLANDWDVEDLQEWGVENVDGFGGEEKEIVEDEAPEISETEVFSKEGEVYSLGDHRLMCGDSTDAGAVAILMCGQKADMAFTDPPYGMKKEKDGVLNDNLNYDDLLKFNKKWIPITFANLKEVGSWYCWGIDEPLMDIYSEILKPMKKEKKITFRNLLTWDKGVGQGQMSEGFRMYPTADEKCLFVMCGVQGFNNNSDNYYEGWDPIRKYLMDEAKKVGLGAKKLKEICGVNMYSHWFTKSQWGLITEEHYRKLQTYYNDIAFKREYEEIKREYEEIKREYEEIKREYYSTRSYFNNAHDNMNNVWRFARTSKEERASAGDHATPKPLALCGRAIKSSSREKEIVLDVFGGSGSTLIACEQLGRKCFMMELDPKYVDVIRKRWVKFTTGGEDNWQALTPKEEYVEK